MVSRKLNPTWTSSIMANQNFLQVSQWDSLYAENIHLWNHTRKIIKVLNTAITWTITVQNSIFFPLFLFPQINIGISVLASQWRSFKAFKCEQHFKITPQRQQSIPSAWHNDQQIELFGHLPASPRLENIPGNKDLELDSKPQSNLFRRTRIIVTILPTYAHTDNQENSNSSIQCSQ